MAGTDKAKAAEIPGPGLNPAPPSHPLRVPLICLAAVALLIAHGLSSLPLQIRFALVPLNYLSAAALALLLPVMLIWVSLRSPWRWLTATGYIASVLVTIPVLLFVMFALIGAAEVEDNLDPALTFLSQAGPGPLRYRLYRTNCGATCNYGLGLRREYDFPLGIRLVTPVWFLYPAEEGIVQLAGDTVRVVYGSKVLGTVQP